MRQGVGIKEWWCAQHSKAGKMHVGETATMGAACRSPLTFCLGPCRGGTSLSRMTMSILFKVSSGCTLFDSLYPPVAIGINTILQSRKSRLPALNGLGTSCSPRKPSPASPVLRRCSLLIPGHLQEGRAFYVSWESPLSFHRGWSPNGRRVSYLFVCAEVTTE